MNISHTRGGGVVAALLWFRAVRKIADVLSPSGMGMEPMIDLGELMMILD